MCLTWRGGLGTLGFQPRRPTLPKRRRTDTGLPGSYLEVDFGHVVVRAAANSHDLEGLTRPLLEALAKLAQLESTYLTIFDWERREQEVRFVHSTGDIQVSEGMRIPIPEGFAPEALLGVTRSPSELPKTHPDSKVAQRLGLKSYVSVPVSVAKHVMFGMICGASREPREVSERIVSVMEFFAQIIADHVTRSAVAATEKRAAVAEEQLRSRARFLAVAEHQLKTPLTTLLAVPQMLRTRWAELEQDERNEMLESIERNADALRQQIDELLLEARADVQARELASVEVDLTSLVRRIAEAFSSVSASHVVTTDAAPGMIASVDPAALYQVLGHLLDNAIKHSPDGGTIELRVALTDDEIKIEVADEGVGVPEGVDIFEAFQRGPSTAEIPGIGLGLHIVRNLVNAMGGSAIARRNPGKGSTFSVRFPHG